MPQWVLDWSKESLIFIVVLTFVTVVLMKIDLRQAILVDFGYMILALPLAYRNRNRRKK
ncbi:hypothetical protein [Lactiplantibacillus songbeiensis]|jgi:hypothetical protein|uniref:Bacteriocin immunity protein n=1 Tax=Lactiplantibacillus songbeiensis TaxID=2559920 RepID=A0ABW4C4Z0_9LACO|nr:hypothetical protein [Lactiplantibacillus songbeiensis]